MSGMKKYTIIIFLISLLISSGCVAWKPLQFPPSSQPVFLGQRIFPDSTGDDFSAVAADVFQCQLSYDMEESVNSESEHISLELGGHNEVQENIAKKLDEVLDADTLKFIADVEVEIGVRAGISVSNVILSVLASLITDDESDVGFYHSEFFQIRGTVYKIDKNEDEN